MTLTTARETYVAKSSVRVAILPHVGTAKGHLLRAISVAQELTPQAATLLMLPTKARRFVASHFPHLHCRWFRYSFGHNDILGSGLSEIAARARDTLSDLEQAFNEFRPDVVIGLPGLQTSLICRALGLRHISLLHGPWLMPEYSWSDLATGEKAVVKSWRHAIRITDTLASVMAYHLGHRYAGYENWLEGEEVWCAQEFAVPLTSVRPQIGFISAEYGPMLRGRLHSGCIAVMFGSVLRGANKALASSLADLGRPVVIIGGRPSQASGEFVSLPSVAVSSIARRAHVAVTHGGIGTIGAFARTGTPQVFVPHDLDQSINAMLASRSGFGTSVPLDYWGQRSPFGRRYPPVDVAALTRLVRLAGQPQRPVPADRDPPATLSSLLSEVSSAKETT